MQRQTKHSAGYDIPVTKGGWILPFCTKVFETETSFDINNDEVVLLFPRSSLGFKKNLRLVNSVAVIDKDFYPNKCKVKLHNFGFKPRKIEDNERVAQAVVVNYRTLANEVEPVTKRTGGIGSTDKHKE